MENLVLLTGTIYGKVRKVKNKTLDQKVRYVLEHSPETRNSDITLTTHIWWYFHKDSIIELNGQWYVSIKDLHDLPREDNVKRIRARIQNDEKLFLPTDEKVIQKRSKMQSKWRKDLGYGSIYDYINQ